MRGSLKMFSWFFIIVLMSCAKPLPKPQDLESGWKFMTGDNLDYARPDFPDTNWKEIHPNRLWEDQGYENYDGYAWYRLRFMLPKTIREEAFLQDSLQFLLGKIDDTDQTFLNGRLIGQNGKRVSLAKSTKPGKFEGDSTTWNRERRYVLGAGDERILWDQVNLLAIRVNDHGGGGGCYSPLRQINMVGIKDYLKIDTESTPFTTVNQTIFMKKVVLKSSSKRRVFGGTFTIRIFNMEQEKTIYKEEHFLKMITGRSFSFPFQFDVSDAENCVAIYEFTEQNSKTKVRKVEEVPYILTPQPSDKPKINGAKVFGVRPGAPFLFRIPATGDQPMTFAVENLPVGLAVDSTSGIITGSVAEAGEYPVVFVAQNRKGKSARPFKIIVGDKIALTPPLGWNSWNCWGLSVSDDKVRAAANYMVSSGLADHGWTYINIDDGWEAPTRNFRNEITTNEKFPNMKKLAGYVHSKGLRIGIYSSPGPQTCGGYLGSYEHEVLDATTYARWDIDYLKYDWCSYNNIAPDHSLPELKKPYLVMRDALNLVNRDIVYSLCQYGMGNVWEWGDEVGGNSWRTTGDIVDTWESMTQIGFEQTVQHPYAKPGCWNDPDMLVVGLVGWGPNLHQTRLSVNEQYTHISLWALLASPLLLGCDLSRLDDFTLNLLTNDEVLAVNQDPLGKQAQKILTQDTTQIWVKELEDGSLAVGLFNLTSQKRKVKLNWSQLNLSGEHIVRDLWRQKDLGTFETEFEASVPVHGVVLIQVQR